MVPHVVASFGALLLLDKPPSEVAEDMLAMADQIERFLYRLGRWSEAYEVQLFHSKERDDIRTGASIKR